MQLPPAATDVFGQTRKTRTPNKISEFRWTEISWPTNDAAAGLDINSRSNTPKEQN